MRILIAAGDRALPGRLHGVRRDAPGPAVGALGSGIAQAACARSRCTATKTMQKVRVS